MAKKNIRVLGLDVGSRNFGVAIVSRNGSDNLLMAESLYLADSKIGDRLVYLENKLIKYIEDYMITHVIFEAPVIRGRNSVDVLYTCGVVHMAASKTNKPISYVSPSSVKKEVAGKGTADKKDIEAAVNKHLHLPEDHKFDKDHASDAAAIALYHLFKNH